MFLEELPDEGLNGEFDSGEFADTLEDLHFTSMDLVGVVSHGFTQRLTVLPS